MNTTLPDNRHADRSPREAVLTVGARIQRYIAEGFNTVSAIQFAAKDYGLTWDRALYCYDHTAPQERVA